MAIINVLDKLTIDKIAAGEVVEKPLNVVKELVENSIDAMSSSITVEIKDGGSSLIRVTDNGTGIEKTQVKKAFMSHATSKIVCAEDLLKISSLGFRGEALSSISAIAEVELITKTNDDLLGIHYIIEGGNEVLFEEVGAPCGTTFLIRNIFYNVPARKKFLKSNITEAGYISDIMEHIALSHPEISFKFINNNKTIFTTSGNGNLKEVIYRIYGKDISDKLLDIKIDSEILKCTGFIGKPEVNRGSRAFENFFVNGRYINCDIFYKALEEGYGAYLMQHRFPFCVLLFDVNPSEVDVNVHPSKKEIRLQRQNEIYEIISSAVNKRISEVELIPEISINKVQENNKIAVEKTPEIFETNRIEKYNLDNNTAIPLKIIKPTIDEVSYENEDNNAIKDIDAAETHSNSNDEITDFVQQSLFEDRFLGKEAKEHYEILGQIFDTYWLIAFDDKLYMMDQHAAHEKVKYERLCAKINGRKEIASQEIVPPSIIELSSKENSVINQYLGSFKRLGFEIDDFGLGSIVIRSVPTDLYGLNEVEFFKEILDELIENPLKGELDVINNKLASMACKAAVKGNTPMNKKEVAALLDELLTLDNPYNCPHGRPTIISMSKYEIEKKFKRIV